MTLGLDDLIIVNPGAPPPDTAWFLGADGGLYRVDPAETGEASDRHAKREALGEIGELPRYFLGDDGLLYETR